MNPETNPQTGKEEYSYILIYVDDLLHIHTEAFVKDLKGVYRLKYGSLEPPTLYLGTNVQNVKLGGGSIDWSTTS